METHLTALRAFCLVAEHGSLAVAADRMHLTPSAVSRLLRRLEEDLDLALFDRSERRLHLSPSGRLLHVRAREVLASVGDLSAYARAIRAGEGPEVLRVAALSRHAQSIVAPAVARLLGGCRATVQVRIDVHTQRDFAWSSRSRPFDVGFGNLEGTHPKLDFERLVSSPLVAVLPRGHRLAGARTVQAGDLAAEQLVVTVQDTIIARHIERLVQRATMRYVTVEASTTQVAFALVAHGAGVHLTDALAAAGMEAGGLAVVTIAPRKAIAFGVFYPSPAARQQPATVALVEHVRAVAQGALAAQGQ